MTELAPRRYFGTDGIRGPANQPPLDPETLVGLGAVLGRLIRTIDAQPLADARCGVLFGHDGRLSAEMIRTSIVAGLLSEGLDAYDCGLVTTPALAHETRLGGHSAGIMISASHNPADDNGIKIFGADGAKVPDQLEREIEDSLGAPLLTRPYRRPGCARRLELGAAKYRGFLRERFPNLDLHGVRLLVDCANGGGSRLVPDALRGFGAEVVVRNDYPTGSNINDGCGALHPGRVAPEVPAYGCVLGLCLDGDGDRAVFVDETGTVVHGDALITLLALARQQQGRLANDAVAVTVMSNLGLKKALSRAGIGVVETPVGDRAVVAAMIKGGLTLGGENSGHIVFGDEHFHTGDGLYTCLEVLGTLQRSGRTLGQLAGQFTAYPQKLVNVTVKSKPPLMSLPRVVATYKEIEQELGNDGRIVLRYSGTENLCRVMVEAASDALVSRCVDRLVQAVRDSIA
jgi:phosphoglucosamine mutase